MADPLPFLVVPTANPDERAFITFVRAQWDVVWPAAGVTIYKDWQQAIYPQAQGDFGGYVYADSVQAQGDWLGFLWVKRKSETEKNTPYRTYTKNGNHRWPPVLYRLDFLQNPAFPASTNGPDGSIVRAPRIFVRQVFKPESNEGSMFKYEYFLSDTKYNIPPHPAPQPQEVSYDFLGCSGTFPECLHEKIEIKPQRTAIAKYSVGGGEQGAAGGVLSGQVFPKTRPFVDWIPYIVSDEQTFSEGQYNRVRVTVYPPILNNITRS
jgi:hypothetical protein